MRKITFPDCWPGEGVIALSYKVTEEGKPDITGRVTCQVPKSGKAEDLIDEAISLVRVRHNVQDPLFEEVQKMTGPENIFALDEEDDSKAPPQVGNDSGTGTEGEGE